jgi:hypothetical protein
MVADASNETVSARRVDGWKRIGLERGSRDEANGSKRALFATGEGARPRTSNHAGHETRSGKALEALVRLPPKRRNPQPQWPFWQVAALMPWKHASPPPPQLLVSFMKSTPSPLHGERLPGP